MASVGWGSPSPEIYPSRTRDVKKRLWDARWFASSRASHSKGFGALGEKSDQLGVDHLRVGPRDAMGSILYGDESNSLDQLGGELPGGRDWWNSAGVAVKDLRGHVGAARY
jgi:hypothetical protein